MFDPFLRDFIEIAPFAVGFVGLSIGLYWIHWIMKDAGEV